MEDEETQDRDGTITVSRVLVGKPMSIMSPVFTETGDTHSSQREAKCRPEDQGEEDEPSDHQPDSVRETVPRPLNNRLPNSADGLRHNRGWDELESDQPGGRKILSCRRVVDDAVSPHSMKPQANKVCMILNNDRCQCALHVRKRLEVLTIDA